MRNNKRLFAAALILILANAVFWLVFAILLAANVHPAPPQSAPLRWTMAGLSLIGSITLSLLCLLVKRRHRWAFYLTIAILATLVLLTLTDNFGLADLVYLVLTAVPLALLIHLRKWYLGMETSVKE